MQSIGGPRQSALLYALPTSFQSERAHPPSAAAIQAAETANQLYRRVLYTHDGDANGEGAFQQVVMALGYADTTAQSLGAEVHHRTAQYFAVVSGTARVRLGLSTELVTAGQRWTVPPGWWHDVERVNDGPVQLFVQYTPPHHPPGRVDATRASAEAADAAWAEAGALCAYEGCGARGRYAPYANVPRGRIAFCSPRHEELHLAALARGGASLRLSAVSPQ